VPPLPSRFMVEPWRQFSAVLGGVLFVAPLTALAGDLAGDLGGGSLAAGVIAGVGLGLLRIAGLRERHRQ
jgi:hypothetical protein